RSKYNKTVFSKPCTGVVVCPVTLHQLLGQPASTMLANNDRSFFTCLYIFGQQQDASRIKFISYEFKNNFITHIFCSLIYESAVNVFNGKTSVKCSENFLI